MGELVCSKAKWITAAITAALWLAWVAADAAWRLNPDISVAHVVATQVLQMAAGMSTIVLILGFLISPVIATARVWRELGRREQERECCKHAPVARVVPFRAMHSDN